MLHCVLNKNNSSITQRERSCSLTACHPFLFRAFLIGAICNYAPHRKGALQKLDRTYPLCGYKVTILTLGRIAQSQISREAMRLLRRLQQQYRRLEEEQLHPGLRELAVPAFLSVLFQVYAVSLPTARLTFSRQKNIVQAIS
jgi:hypothetical protein